MASRSRKPRVNGTVAPGDRAFIETQSQRQLRRLRAGWCTNKQLQFDVDTGRMLSGNHTARNSEYRHAGDLVLKEHVWGGIHRYRVPPGKVDPGYYFVHLIGEDETPHTSPRYDTAAARDKAVIAFFATAMPDRHPKYCLVHVYLNGRGKPKQEFVWDKMEGPDAKVA